MAAAFEWLMSTRRQPNKISACRQLNEMSRRRQLYLLAPRGIPREIKKNSYSPNEKLVSRETDFVRTWVSFERCGRFERPWHSNDVRIVNIYGNVSRNEDQEWARKFWKEV